MKMHLTGRVPNEGARLLAWWIGRECAGNLIAAAARLSTSAAMLQRLLEGAVLPGEDLVERIGRGTQNSILRPYWRMRPQGGWFVRPLEEAAA